jgi:ABC-2 type transport system permease protein
MAATHVIGAECRKGLLIMWHYRFNILMQLITVSVTFMFVLLVAGHGSLRTTATSASMLGYVVWIYAVNVILGVSAEMVGEAQTGTLEQMNMSIAPTELLLIGRALASMIATTLQVAVFELALWVFLRRSVPVTLSGIAILLLTLVGHFGFGLLLGGATLIFKNIQALTGILVNLFIFVNGTLLAVSYFPHWLATVANALPSTRGVTLLRSVVIEKQSLTSSAVDGQLLGLILNSAVYFALGWMVFEYGARVARRRGTLGQY